MLRPYNEKEFLTDKLSIVDIKAKDSSGVVYQIEVQLSTPSHLANRMLYNWSDLYKTQIREGESFSELKPVISLWLLTGSFYKDDVAHHHFQMFDRQNDVLMTDHCSVHVFELEKWRKPETLQLIDIWLYFFKEAKNWHKLPDSLVTFEEMRHAMKVLQTFSEKEKAYHQYQARVNYIREQRTLEIEREKDLMLRKQAEAWAQRESARAEQAEDKVKQAENKAKQAENKAKQAEVEQERLLALLRSQGIDPQSF